MAATGRLPLARECYRQNQKSSFIAIFRFKAIQRYSKAFKAIQRFLAAIIFLCAHSKTSPATTALPPTEWSLDLLWHLEVAPKAFGVGAFAMAAVREDQSITAKAIQAYSRPPRGGYIVAVTQRWPSARIGHAWSRLVTPSRAWSHTFKKKNCLFL
jgi:hypothetical protein